MERNLFLDLLRLVSDRGERKKLLDFVRSPFFNLSEKVDLQVKIIEQAWKWWDEGHLKYWDEHAVFTQLFGEGEPFSQQRIDRFKTAVVALIRRFFAEHKRRENQHPAELLRWEMQYYRHKMDYLHFLQVEKEARGLLNKRENDVSIEDMLQVYLLEAEVAWLDPGDNRQREENYLTDSLQALDAFWLAARARWSCAMLNQQQRYTIELETFSRLFFRLLRKYAAYKPTQKLITRAFERAARLFEPTETPVAVLSDFMAFIDAECSGQEASLRDELEALAANYCVRQRNLGHSEFIHWHFKILRARLDSGRIYRQGKILPSDFQSIATTALKLARNENDLDWVRRFLDEHRNRLYNREAAEEMIRYNYANYYFYMGDYDRALRNLRETYKELNFKILSKVLEIKVLYETDDERLDERLNAHNVYFRRETKLPELKRAVLTRFIGFTRRLCDPLIGNSQTRIERLKREIDEKPTAEAEWLREKVQQREEKGKSNRKL